jgi:hypothetical protein
MNDFEEKNWEIYHNPKELVSFLTNLLDEGKLGLVLGAGASMAFGLPGWNELVKRCCNGNVTFSNDLERDIDSLKRHLNGNRYLKKVQEELYKKKSKDDEEIFDHIELAFSTTDKDLLIAISSLIISRTRGKVDRILNLNYDSILEWYLKVNGLKTFVNFREGLIQESNDVEIIHPHGYLPHESLNTEMSDRIVFSWKELEHFKGEKDNYLKDLMYYFFKTKCFLSIGVSPKTLKEYIASHVACILGDYSKNSTIREIPFGFALISPEESSKEDTENLRNDYGIITFEIAHSEIPPFLFNLAQKLAGIEVPYISSLTR